MVRALTFLWPAERAKKGLVEVARLTGTGAVVDLTAAGPDTASTVIDSTGVDSVLVTDRQLTDRSFETVLGSSPVRTVFVECPPGLDDAERKNIAVRLTSPSRFEWIPVTGDHELVRVLIGMERPPKYLALKGNEAAGFTGSDTISVLFATTTKVLKEASRPPEILVFGGVALPEAAAAFLCTGARGIIFESVHWLTDLVDAPEQSGRLLARLRSDSTRIIGSSLSLSCRVFDRGNSHAVRALDQRTRELACGQFPPASLRAFINETRTSFKSALAPDAGREQIVPLGIEAIFAQSFVDRFGRSTQDALAGFSSAVRRSCAHACESLERFLDESGQTVFGTRYPFVQGAMSWITDKLDFARAVADSGALPTLALGFRSREQLERNLGDVRAGMGDRPYAVNVVALNENTFRDEQLTWIERLAPPYVVVAAGDPSFAGRLTRQGMQVLYLASDEGLIRLALKEGVRTFILEGMESGGHLGPHSTLTLAQLMLEMARREPDLCRDARFVFAGGIVDASGVVRAALMGASAVQMGTAYLATREVVETGALSRTYQQMVLAAKPGSTTVTGGSVGLPVRALANPKTEAIASLECRVFAGQSDESSFRRELEALAAGSLLVAARGVRDPLGPCLDAETCRREGQFMCGATVGCLDSVRSLENLHRDLAEPRRVLRVSPELMVDSTRPTHQTPRNSKRPERERIAITAAAMVNALGNTPDAIWDAVISLRSGITEIPSYKWNHDLHFDPRPQVPGKTYSRVGAFLHLEISRKDIGVSPQDFATMTDSTKLTLWLARRAVADSGLVRSCIPPERISVLVSQNSAEMASCTYDILRFVAARELTHDLAEKGFTDPRLLSTVTKLLAGNGIPIDDTSLVGRLSSTAGGFICNQYNLKGPSFSVSAACATSLVALYDAVHLIRSGVIDAAVVGGGEESLTPFHYLEFSAIGALSGQSGQPCPTDERSRPFDITRDGMVLGEGGVMVILERESVARERQAPILGFITGIGASNNDHGLVESLAENQEIAIRASFADAGYGPHEVDLVECHATSTRLGDLQEVKALKRFYSGHRRTVLSSFKSQIGHTLGASGLTNLVRGLLAVRHGVFPATPTYRQPDPEIALEASGFVVPRETVPWPAPPDRPRRFQVNAFGFGGTNYVVQVEENAPERMSRREWAPSIDRTDLPESPESVISHRSAGRSDETRGLEGVVLAQTRRDGRVLRVAVSSEKEILPDDLRRLISPKGRTLSDREQRELGHRGIFLGEAMPSSPPLALVFSGQGTQYAGMGRVLYETVPAIRETMDRLASLADFDLVRSLFQGSEEDLRNTRYLQPALFILEYALARHLLSLGVKPVALAGHSLGELCALCIAGVYSEKDGIGIVNRRARCMEKLGSQGRDAGAMVAVDAPKEVLEPRLAATRTVSITNHNSPRQVVLGGATDEVRALASELASEGFWTRPLKVGMAFHSSFMKVVHDELWDYVSNLEFHVPTIPVLSNTTRCPFPDDPDEIKRILMRHMEEPVHWTQNVTSLWNDHGVRLFVEVGPRDVLCGLITDTFEKASCVPTCLPDDELRTYRTALARLYVFGHLPPPNPAVVLSLDADISPPEPQCGPAGGTMPDGPDSSRKEPPCAPSGGSVTAKGPDATPSPKVAAGSLLEQIVRIIMDATGYDRDEIQPDLDLRRDLAIRSSRFPVIMNACEQEFGIVVGMEDFIGVRTVRDLASTVSRVIDRDGSKATKSASSKKSGPIASREIGLHATRPDAYEKPTERSATVEPKRRPILPLHRYVIREAPLDGPDTFASLELDARYPVVLLGTDPDRPLARGVGEWLARKKKVRVETVAIRGEKSATGGVDLGAPEGADELVRRLEKVGPFGGLVIALDGPPGDHPLEAKRLSQFLAGLFEALRCFVRSPAKVFCLLVRSDSPTDDDTIATGEGAHGMLLAAALEYSSVLFRTLSVTADASLDLALGRALDPSEAPRDLILRGSGWFTHEARFEPIRFLATPTLLIEPGEVIIVSGGGRGITTELAAAFAPLGPRLILVGRTRPEPGIDYGRAWREAGGDLDKGARLILEATEANISPDRVEERLARHRAALEVAKTLERLRQQGIEAVYSPCDVTDSDAVERLVTDLVKKHGRVAGILHGAGIIQDAFVQFQNGRMFREVVDVKLIGAINLYRSSRSHGLKFFVALSSVAALHGNVGQANYCCGNWAMAALVKSWSAQAQGLRGLVLWLPPLEGAGMADQPETRQILEMRGYGDAFVHMKEMATVACQELILGSHRSSVMPARALPTVRGIPVSPPVEPPAGELVGPTGVTIDRKDVPLVDSIRRLDLREGEIEVSRTFSAQRDLWLADHVPTRQLRHPLVSAVMGIEAFLEAARILHPEFLVREVRDITYRDVLECPIGVPREALIHCRTINADREGIVCQVNLSSSDLSPTGKLLDRSTTHFEATLVLGVRRSDQSDGEGFPIDDRELDTGSMAREDILGWYEARSGLRGSYRVLETLEGTGPSSIRATMICRKSRDFEGMSEVNYHSTPYVLEAFHHLVLFHAQARNPSESRSLLPASVRRIVWFRGVSVGERLVLEGRRSDQTREGSSWKVRAVDSNGRVVLMSEGLCLRWLDL